jgi:hypothetical protein
VVPREWGIDYFDNLSDYLGTVRVLKHGCLLFIIDDIFMDCTLSFDLDSRIFIIGIF